MAKPKMFTPPMDEEWGDEEEMLASEEMPEEEVAGAEEKEYPNGEVHAGRCACAKCAGKQKGLVVALALGEKKMSKAKEKMARKFGKGVVRGVNRK